MNGDAAIKTMRMLKLSVTTPGLQRIVNMYDGEHWEDKACIKCGHVRRVKVRDRKKYVPAEGMRIQGVPSPEVAIMGTWIPDGQSWTPTCKACDLEENGRKYQRLADENFRRAAAERQRQKKNA